MTVDAKRSIVGKEKNKNTREFNYSYGGTPMHLSSGNNTLRCMFGPVVLCVRADVYTCAHIVIVGCARRSPRSIFIPRDRYLSESLYVFAINNNRNNTSVFGFGLFFFSCFSRCPVTSGHDRIMREKKLTPDPGFIVRNVDLHIAYTGRPFSETDPPARSAMTVCPRTLYPNIRSA